MWMDIREIEANAVIYIHTDTHTYLHPKISNETGFRHRQPRLVTYAT